VLFEDEYLLAINKPLGLCVQDGTNVSISIDRVLRLANIDAKIVHRIDKDTTGVLLLAKTAFAAAELSKLFREKKIHKSYTSVLCGVPDKPSGTIESIIKKGSEESNKECYACTKFNILANYENLLSLVEMMPITGRKHQIRVHSQEINCPILGDSKNKPKTKNKLYDHSNLHLHAHSLNFKMLDKTYNLKADFPVHFLNTMKKYFPTQKIKGYEL
jgi:23S rRNA pseudouridine955/2504/2580 synthase